MVKGSRRFFLSGRPILLLPTRTRTSFGPSPEPISPATARESMPSLNARTASVGTGRFR